MRKIRWRMMNRDRSLEQLIDLVNRSPYYELLGMEVQRIGKGVARVRMPVKKELTHAYGIVQGGAIASLADSAVAMALLGLVTPQEIVATIEFKINFFAPVRQGRLIARAKIVHQGSRTAVGDVDIKDEKGKVVAKALATYSIRRV